MANHILAIHSAGGEIAFAVAVSTLRSLEVTALGRVASSSPVIAELAGERSWDRVIASVPAEQAVHRFLEFPFHDRRRLSQAVGPALEEHVPLSLDDAAVSFDATSSTRTGRILAAMAARTAIDEQLEALAAHEIVPERLVWAPSAVLEIYRRAIGAGKDFVAVDLGEEAAVIGAYRDGALCGLHVVRRTDDDVFVRNVGWSLRTLEHLPDSIVVGGSRAGDVVGPLAEILAGLSIEHLPFDCPVQLHEGAAPGWRGLAAPLGLVLAASGDLGPPALEFAVERDDDTPALELAGTGRRLAPWAAAAGVLLAASVGIEQTRVNAQAQRLQERADAIYGAVMPGRVGGAGQRVKMELRVSELEQRRAELSGSGPHGSPLAVLVRMSQAVPKQLDVEFESYIYNPPSVRLRGQGGSFETVTRLQEVLESVRTFGDISVSDVRTAVDGAGVVFELRFKIEDAQQPA